MSSRTPLKDQHARVPVDKVADRVISPVPKKYQYDFNYNKAQLTSDTPLPTHSVPLGVTNLAGLRSGSLIVIGFSHAKKGKDRIWIVRCVCGLYLTRREKSLKKSKTDEDCCDRCSRVRSMRRGYLNPKTRSQPK